MDEFSSLGKFFSIPSHPIGSISFDHDLSLVFEIEDPLLMSEARLTEVIEQASSAQDVMIRCYLQGVLDHRRWGYQNSYRGA
ncbi:hypothetical protein [Paraburkholderia domus]|uniref:hypothetical protein n=1 Tax=Paraburkholderia domus TaxID=2793075 RepID=UPI001B2F14BA|nr:hypothetical protein [Paraburkholderia domus]CAE6697239.1 hypothetical protein R75483_00658 [Paraburkholderia domus]